MENNFLSLESIAIRDPFIIKDNEGGYVMFGTTTKHTIYDSDGVYYYTSLDLKNWSNPKILMTKNDFGAKCKDFWSPEFYFINGTFYMLITLTFAKNKRGSYLYKSGSLLDKYELVCRVTPKNEMSLHATMYEECGEYYIVYSHEWKEVGVGEINAVKINKNFDGIEIDSKIKLFDARANNYKKNSNVMVTDAPFCYKKNDDLYILWSTYDRDKKYLTLMAKSSNGKIKGEYTQLAPLVVDDGGHAMIFTDYDGVEYIAYHSPGVKNPLINKVERPKIKAISYEFGLFTLKEQSNSYKAMMLYSKFEQVLTSVNYELCKKYGIENLSLSHQLLITMIYNYKEVSMQKLSSLVSKTPQTITTLVKKLEQLGYVKIVQDTIDKRKYKAIITEKGIDIANIISLINDETNKMLSLNLVNNEYENMLNSIKKITNCLTQK